MNREKLRLREAERRQVSIESRSIDELLPGNHRARIVWEVTGKLDLSEFYKEIRTKESSAGRCATDPRLLVTLWLYAATQGVGSARELARRSASEDPYKWICGGVTVNHRILSEFRVGHGEALDKLFTEVLTALVYKKVVKIKRVSQDGMRVRASAGASSFRRKSTLLKLKSRIGREIERLRRDVNLETPRRRKCKLRALERKNQRLQQALELLPELEGRKAKLTLKNWEEADTEGRVSTTDPDAQVMRMADGGYRPAYNIQLGADTESRAIVGVDVTNRGVDTEESAPMRVQIRERTGKKVKEQLLDAGYLKLTEIESAHEQGVDLYVAGRPPRNPNNRSSPYAPSRGDSPPVAAWRKRMNTKEGAGIYGERGKTSETINADLRCYRGLGKITVRGMKKVKSLALWAALAYNLMHFGSALI